MRRSRLAALVGACVVGFVLCLAGAAYAYWQYTDSSNGNAARSVADSLPTGSTPNAPTKNAPNGNTVTVTFNQASTVTGHTGLTSYAVKRYPGAVTTSASCSVSAGLVTCSETGVPDGVWTYTDVPRVGVNWVGTESAASASVTVDTTAPTVAISFPTAAAYNAGGWTAGQPIAGTASDATSGVASSAVSVQKGNGASSCWTGTGATFTAACPNYLTATGTTNWNKTFTTANFGADDTYTVAARATDNVGNTAVSSASFVYDTVAPAPAVVSPAFTSSTTPTVSGTAGVQGADATHSADASTVTVKIFSGPNTGGTLLQTINNVAVSGGNWSTPVAALTANAQYTAQVLQSDGAGNSGSGTKTFVVDTVAPAPAVVSPAFTSSTTPTVSGTAGVQGADATHSADASTVTVKIFSGPNTGGTLLQTINNVAVSGGNWSTPVAALTANAQYTAQVLQSDGAGNSGSGTKTFVVDTVAPAVTLTTPANNSSGSDTTPTFSGAAGAQAADATHSADSTTVTVYICSGTPGSCNASSGSLVQTLTTTASGSSWSVDASTLALGTYQAQAAQSDGAGNTGTSSANTFTVTSGLTITSVERNTGNRKYDFKGTGSATGGTVTVTICKVNTFPCPTTPTNQVAATATASQGSTWTTGQTNNNLDNSGNGLQYWAQATQGSATSAVFLFASTSAEPSAFDVALHNGGVANKADAGDTLVVTYSEPLDATTFCSSWTNVGVQSSSASVAINNTTTNDTLTAVTVSGCSFHFGSVTLGADYVSANVTFSTSTVSWDPTTEQLTITLGGGTGQNTVASNVAPSYTADAAIKDQSGAPISTAAVSGTSSRF